MRQQTVGLLALPQMVKLLDGVVLVVAGVADGYERRVPGPPVRVEPGSGLGVIPGPVEPRIVLARVGLGIALLRHRVLLNSSSVGSGRLRRSQSVPNGATYPPLAPSRSRRRSR